MPNAVLDVEVNSSSMHDCTLTERLFTREEALEFIQHGITEAVSKMEKLFEDKMANMKKRLAEAESATNQLNEQLQASNIKMELHKKSTEKAIQELEKKVNVLQKQAGTQKARTVEGERANNDLEQYSRRNNIRIHGYSMQPGESYKSAVVRLCSTQLHVTVREDDLDAAHPLPSTTATTSAKTASSNPTRQPPPPTIIVRFHQRDLRDTVIKSRSKLKNTGILVTDDLTHQNQKLLRKLHHDPKIERAWSWMGKILAIPKGARRATQIRINEQIPSATKRSQ